MLFFHLTVLKEGFELFAEEKGGERQATTNLHLRSDRKQSA